MDPTNANVVSILQYKKDSFVFLNIPGGTPDPQEEYTLENEGNRTRVLKPKASGPSSWFSGLEYLRLIVGPNHPDHPPCLKELRSIEIISEKFITDYNENIKKYRLNINSNKVKNSSISDGILRSLSPPPTYDKKIDKKFLKSIVKNYLNFLKDLNIDHEKLYEQEIQQDLYKKAVFSNKKFENLTTQLQADYLETLVRTTATNKFGLKESKWTTKDKIAVLIDELARRGPLCVSTVHGRENYEEEPKQLKSPVIGPAIYGWEPGTKKNSDLLKYTKLIIGAAKKGGIEHVYYRYPEDASDPKNPEATKTYAMSYKAFKKEIITLDGAQDRPSPEKHRYAVYGPRNEKHLADQRTAQRTAQSVDELTDKLETQLAVSGTNDVPLKVS